LVPIESRSAHGVEDVAEVLPGVPVEEAPARGVRACGDVEQVLHDVAACRPEAGNDAAAVNTEHEEIYEQRIDQTIRDESDGQISLCSRQNRFVWRTPK
jgi:hypothetical protein